MSATAPPTPVPTHCVVDPEALCECVQRAFAKLPQTGKPGKNEWSVLAAVVMSGLPEPNAVGPYRVVAMGTGNKCLGASSRCLTGDVLNDRLTLHASKSS